MGSIAQKACPEEIAMIRKFRSLFFAVLAVIAAHMIVPGGTAANPAGEPRESKSCIMEVRIAKATNPFGAWDSRTTRKDGASVRAVDLKKGSFDSIPSLSRYAVSGRNFMAVDRKTQEPAVSSEFFSHLARVDATRIEPGEARQIGIFLNASASPVPLRDIALFLLESQIVTTYWHVESRLCLESENNQADVYSAHFRGIHVYFTNHYNEEKIDFFISIDRKSGQIRLLGGR